MPSLQQLLIFILSLPPRPNNSYRKKTSTLFWSLSSSHVLLRLPTRGSSGSVLTKNKTTADSNWSQKTKQECPTGVRTLPHNEVSHLSKCKHLLKKFGIKVDSNNTTMLNFFMSKWQNRKKLIPTLSTTRTLWLLENEPSTQIVAPSVVFTGN